MLPPLFSWVVPEVAPDVALFDSPPVCDCAAAKPPNPTTAATATVANNLFLISVLLCLSRNAEPRPSALTKCRSRLTPCAYPAQRAGDCGVPVSSVPIGFNFLEPPAELRSSGSR